MTWSSSVVHHHHRLRTLTGNPRGRGKKERRKTVKKKEKEKEMGKSHKHGHRKALGIDTAVTFWLCYQPSSSLLSFIHLLYHIRLPFFSSLLTSPSPLPPTSWGRMLRREINRLCSSFCRWFRASRVLMEKGEGDKELGAEGGRGWVKRRMWGMGVGHRRQGQGEIGLWINPSIAKVVKVRVWIDGSKRGSAVSIHAVVSGIWCRFCLLYGASVVSMLLLLMLIYT